MPALHHLQFLLLPTGWDTTAALAPHQYHDLLDYLAQIADPRTDAADGMP